MHASVGRNKEGFTELAIRVRVHVEKFGVSGASGRHSEGWDLRGYGRIYAEFVQLLHAVLLCAIAGEPWKGFGRAENFKYRYIL